MTRLKTIERIELGICGAIDYLQSGGHRSEAVAGLMDAQKLLSKLDADAFWQGYEEGEAAGRSQIRSRHDAEERLDAAMSEAHTTIGSFFDDLRAIYEPKEGSNHHG